jgi:hypothetical protein
MIIESFPFNSEEYRGKTKKQHYYVGLDNLDLLCTSILHLSVDTPRLFSQEMLIVPFKTGGFKGKTKLQYFVRIGEFSLSIHIKLSFLREILIIRCITGEFKGKAKKQHYYVGLDNLDLLCTSILCLSWGRPKVFCGKKIV